MFNPFKSVGHFFEALFGKGPWADEYKEVMHILPQAIEAVKVVEANAGAVGLDILKVTDWLSKTLGTPVNISDIQAHHSFMNLLQDAAAVILRGTGLQAENRILRGAVNMAVIAVKTNMPTDVVNE